MVPRGGIDHLDNIDRQLLIADAIEQSGDAKAAEELRSAAATKRSNISHASDCLTHRLSYDS